MARANGGWVWSEVLGGSISVDVLEAVGIGADHAVAGVSMYLAKVPDTGVDSWEACDVVDDRYW